MLTNFLEHTRCPESIVTSLLGQFRASSEEGESESDAFRAHDNDKAITGNPSTTKPAELLAMLQEPVSAEVRPVKGPQEYDDAISVLRLEQYVDHAISSVNPNGKKSLARQCYYWMRPLFPVSFRKYLQRIALRGWDAIPFPAWPVDVTTEKLMEGMWQLLLGASERKEIPFIWFWPDGRSSSCIMTHDVETSLGRDFCKTMMEMEKRHGIHSSFAVVPEQRYAVANEFLQQIRENGCEVCVHGLNHDGHLFSSQSLFLERAKKIDAYARSWGAIGFRSPVLYRNLSWLPELRFSYDMSVPNLAHLDPQRGGCCTVMPYFIGDLLELPLTTTQDYSLFHILQQRSLDLWKKQIGMIQERNGLISFIIHPDYVTETWSSNLYNDLLCYLAALRSSQGVWIALPREVDSWWRARREMTLIPRDGSWEITGPQAERARVAYASLEDGRIEYRIEEAKTVAVGE